MAKNGKVELSREEVLHLAKLAGLTLTEQEIKKYQQQLSETVEYVQNLEELDTNNISPTNSVVNLSNVTFKDGEPNQRKLSRKDLLINNKNIIGTSYVVKRIMQ